jgi:hypothetical protein
VKKIVLMLCVAATVGASVPQPTSAHPQLHRACAQAFMGKYYVGVGHVSCRFAKRWTRRMTTQNWSPWRLGWRCGANTSGGGPRFNKSFGTCVRGGRIFHYAPAYD